MANQEASIWYDFCVRYFTKCVLAVVLGSVIVRLALRLTYSTVWIEALNLFSWCIHSCTIQNLVTI